MDPQQQYCLKWNSFSSNLASSFSNLFKSESLTDVTLLCGDTIFKAHKLILAACSKKFHDLFGTAPSNGSNVCVILEATTADNMAALLEFMYKGEVHVSQESLSTFLKAAETLQVKGLSIEHGRLTAHSHGTTTAQAATPLESPTIDRRQQRNNLTSSLSHTLKQECDSLMQHATSSGIGGFSSYMPPHIYRPLNFDPIRKRPMKSPFTEQETRDSVLRDGSKASSGSVSPSSKGYRPASSASTTAPTEADTMKAERVSPQQSRYENHNSPSTTAGNGNGNGTPIPERHDRSERNGGSETGDEIKRELIDINQTGAEDLRVKMETEFSPPTRPPSNTVTPQTPTTPFGFVQETIDDSKSTAAEMLNIWPASKLANKGGSVNTADGKKLRCPLCERLYGYETNLRAHIRQRHQGIRVPCPYCTRTFTRNNTVRRHIAREHKTEQEQQSHTH